jgi:hypothetical protein
MLSKLPKIIGGCIAAFLAYGVFQSFELRSVPQHHRTAVVVDGQTYYHDDDVVTVRDQNGEEHSVNREDLDRQH